MCKHQFFRATWLVVHCFFFELYSGGIPVDKYNKDPLHIYPCAPASSAPLSVFEVLLMSRCPWSFLPKMTGRATILPIAKL